MFLTQLHADGLHFDLGICSGVFIRRAESILEMRLEKIKRKARVAASRPPARTAQEAAEAAARREEGEEGEEEAAKEAAIAAAEKAAAEKAAIAERKKFYFDFAPLLRLGYRWVFPSVNMFLDWDFIGLPTSFTTFKLGGYFLDRKLAVYGIIDPIVGMVPGVFHTLYAAIGSIGFGFGAMVGGGVAYQVSRDISLLGEVHVGLPYKIFETKDPLGGLPSVQKIDFSPYVRGVVGISFHSREMNKD